MAAQKPQQLHWAVFTLLLLGISSDSLLASNWFILTRLQWEGDTFKNEPQIKLLQLPLTSFTKAFNSWDSGRNMISHELGCECNTGKLTNYFQSTPVETTQDVLSWHFHDIPPTTLTLMQSRPPFLSPETDDGAKCLCAFHSTYCTAIYSLLNKAHQGARKGPPCQWAPAVSGCWAVQKLQADIHHVHQEGQVGKDISTQHRLERDNISAQTETHRVFWGKKKKKRLNEIFTKIVRLHIRRYPIACKCVVYTSFYSSHLQPFGTKHFEKEEADMEE